MSQQKQFRLPDLGEGLTEGEILKWLVQPGDTVTLNQPIVEVETAKAAVEVPSPYAGVVNEIHHAEGETVDVGTPIITFDVDADASSVATPVTEPPAQSAALQAADMVPDIPVPAGGTSQRPDHETDDEAVEPGLIGGPAPGGRTSVLVGYGPRQSSVTRRPRKSATPPAAAASVPEVAPPAGPGRHPVRHGGLEVGRAATQRLGRETGAVAVLAKPPVRKLARDLGVDLQAITGTGPGGTITRADIESAATTTPDAPAMRVVAAPDFDPTTREQRIPIKGVRKHTAAAVTSSAFTAPHVTEFLTCDVTESMNLLDRLSASRDFRDVRLTPVALVARALILAVRRNPMVNASWDEAAQEIVVKDYVNLGIAAATPRGLIVPNIKDAGRLSLRELAEALSALVATARSGKTSPAEMSHGTITITNVGVFGVDSGTPILTPGETAILCLGAIREMPWVHEGEIAVRQVTQLGLSFDHRVVDGEQGSRFLADIGALLTDPGNALAWA
jgi:pyruvate dehydrogenase E2 component (dihydrolipoamide acetyltransferase)